MSNLIQQRRDESFPDEVLSDNIVVFHGGKVGNPPLIPPDGIMDLLPDVSRRSVD